MEEIIVPKGDFGYNINFTVTDANDDAYDLTDYTVTLKLWRPSNPGTLILEEECTIDVAASGTCHYTVQSGDFDTTTTYAGELEATATGKEESVKKFRLVVSESG